MSLALASVEAKLTRAKLHFDELKAAFASYLSNEFHETSAEYDPVAASAKFTGEIKTIPIPFSMIAGDCIHNLRSCLGHLATGLLAAKSIAPTNDTEFPIRRTAPTPNKKGVSPLEDIVPVGHLDYGARRIVTDLQPYAFGANYAKHPLWILDRLWNLDKHSFVLLGPIRLEGTTFKHDNSVSAPVSGRWVTDQVLDDGAKLVFVPDSDVHVDGNTSFRITFQDGTPAEGCPVIETLRSLATFVSESVVKPLIPFA